MRPDACGHEMAASATAHCISMLQDNAGEALLVEQIGHSNLKPRPNTRTSMMHFVSEWRGFKDCSHRRMVPMVHKFPDSPRTGRVT